MVYPVRDTSARFETFVIFCIFWGK
ncbi:protein of unknown function [Cupriavidus taiwanensis]|uniref:Uncharacterized protein n=1 Tax=Cupriavidus taiwanensis TaxID=164546 RepID=A0A976AG24_9BURK|nr:hypothetical protein CBM2600_A120078 [Cupriavidus taiwanensis]SPD64694.1 protein of unknown function [Cupriavidus taiwanensis]